MLESSTSNLPTLGLLMIRLRRATKITKNNVEQGNHSTKHESAASCWNQTGKNDVQVFPSLEVWNHADRVGWPATSSRRF